MRDDLVISPGGAAFVVKDPATRRLYRLGEVEQLVASLLDGETSLDVVRRRVESRFGASLAAAELEEFVAALTRAGLVASERQEAPRHRRVKGNALYLRVRLVDPDMVLDRLARRLAFLFSGPSLVLTGVLVAAGATVAAANGGELVRDLAAARATVPVLAFWGAFVAPVALHELAHALTCKRFGGEVREMGLLLIFFQPALYTNVSDAWLFPERWKRLAVTYAGFHFDLCLASAAVLAWAATGAGVLHYSALAVVAATALRTAFNLNPLLKLDGYYLLSDALGIPNLRPRALAYVRSRLARRAAAVARREAWIYPLYALLSGLFTIVLLAAVFVQIGQRLGVAGAAAVLALVALVVATPAFVRRGEVRSGR